MAKSRGSGVAVMTEDEFLASRGLRSPVTDYNIDKVRIPHGETSRQSKKRQREFLSASSSYQEQRNKARNEYQKLVKTGKIRKPSKYESLIKTARGHEDNPSVQAARRLLKKRGINW